MKTGIIRRIDDLGRIVIPKEILRSRIIPPGTPFEISLEGDRIVLERYDPAHDHEEAVGRIIANLREDELMGDEKRKAIEALETARDLLRQKEERRGE